MKRRKFIQISLIAPLAAASGTRLHGTPASINPSSGSAESEKFILPLANAGLPGLEIKEVSRISSLIESVLTDPSQAQAFFSSPKSYFIAHGLDGSDATMIDSSIAMLVGLTDPAVKKAIESRDYQQLFNYLTATGLFEPREPSVLQLRVQQLISTNIADIKEAIDANANTSLSPLQQASFMSILKKSGITATEDDLAAVSQLLSTQGGATIMACSFMVACAVGIALLAALYVSVAIAVTVAILAGVTISAAVKTAVTVGGDRRTLDYAPFTGQFIKLDPVALRNVQRAFRLAEIAGDQGLQIYTLRIMIREEVTAVLMALSNLHLVNISRTNLPMAINAITCYAEKVSGVGVENGD